MLDKNHRILRRPRTFAIAVECSATQGHAKQRSYIFVYSWHVRLPIRLEPLNAIQLAKVAVKRSKRQVSGLARHFEHEAVGETESRSLAENSARKAAFLGVRSVIISADHS